MYPTVKITTFFSPTKGAITAIIVSCTWTTEHCTTTTNQTVQKLIALKGGITEIIEMKSFFS